MFSLSGTACAHSNSLLRHHVSSLLQLFVIRGNHLAVWSFPVMRDTEERVLLNAVVGRCPTRYPCALLVNLFPEKQDAVYWQWNDYEKRRTWRFCLSFCWMTALEGKNLTFSSHGLRRCREAWQHCYDCCTALPRAMMTSVKQTPSFYHDKILDHLENITSDSEGTVGNWDIINVLWNHALYGSDKKVKNNKC